MCAHSKDFPSPLGAEEWSKIVKLGYFVLGSVHRSPLSVPALPHFVPASLWIRVCPAVMVVGLSLAIMGGFGGMGRSETAAGTASRMMESTVAMSFKGMPTAVLQPSSE